MNWKLACGMLLGLGIAAGCGKDKEEAVKAAADIEAACKDGKKEDALKMGADFYGKNEVFKKAVDASAGTWKVTDMSKYPYCGMAFIEAKTRIEN